MNGTQRYLTMKLIFIVFASAVSHWRPSSAEEKWSWGPNRQGKLVKSELIFVTDASTNVNPSKVSDPLPSTRLGRNLQQAQSKGHRKPSSDTQGRFFGLKKEMCKLGLGFNCGVEYDLIEVQDSYGPPRPAFHPPHNALPHSPGISAQKVLAVQPVALQPVGTPIQAIPLGHVDPTVVGGGLPVGGYGAPPPVPLGGGGYSPPAPPLIGGSYGAPPPLPLSQSYGPPVNGPSIHSAPPIHSSIGINSHVSSFPSSDSSYNHGPISGSPYDIGLDNDPAVKHYHTHTHIHKGNGGQTYGNDYSASSQFISPVNIRPSRSHDQPSHLFGIHPRENCDCVPTYLCPLKEVVGRKIDLPHLDARNKPSNITSISASRKSSTIAKHFDKTINKTRLRRDIKSNFKVVKLNKTKGRQLDPFGRIRNVFSDGGKACRREEVCCRNRGFASRELKYNCGKRNTAGVLGRVRNARYEKQDGDTQFGEYPWQGAILKRENNEIIYVCGATLVNDNHVLTAAHCVKGMNEHELTVRLGEWDVNRKTEFYDHVEVEVSDILIHPQFYSGTLANDIAIITLRTPVDFGSNPHINPICLPNPQSDFTNRHCYVTGWGKDAFGNNGNFQYVLKEVEVPIWGNRGCESALRNTRLGRSYTLDSGMLCAGGEQGKDACKGDGGGPLSCQAPDGSMELAGIVSWGVGCGERGIPGVYVNIPYYMDWITKILSDSSFF